MGLALEVPLTIAIAARACHLPLLAPPRTFCIGTGESRYTGGQIGRGAGKRRRSKVKGDYKSGAALGPCCGGILDSPRH
jgi:hypothetical protein